jgi:putative ABC transport system substrate-binding protein
MRRRELPLALLALASLSALAQQPGRSYRIGAIFAMEQATANPYLAALRDQLAKNGLAEGNNLHIDTRFVAYGSRPNREVVEEVLALRPDAILTCTTLVALAAKAATDSVPVVFTWVSDPVVSGIVKDYARPGGNVTGVSIRFFELAAKRLELARELVPAAKRVAVASGVFDSVLESAMIYVTRAAQKLGLEVFRVVAGKIGWARAVEEAAREGAHAMLVMTPFAVLGAHATAREVAHFTIQQRMATVFPDIESVEAGGLITYATSLEYDLRRGADMLARVLRGKKPGDLPVDQAARFELAVNLKTARAIGLTIPQSIRLRADRLVE